MNSIPAQPRQVTIMTTPRMPSSIHRTVPQVVINPGPGLARPTTGPQMPVGAGVVAASGPIVSAPAATVVGTGAAVVDAAGYVVPNYAAPVATTQVVTANNSASFGGSFMTSDPRGLGQPLIPTVTPPATTPRGPTVSPGTSPVGAPAPGNSGVANVPGTPGAAGILPLNTPVQNLT